MSYQELSSMPRIPLFRLGQSKEEIQPPSLSSYAPTFSLTGLQLGIDNLRHDVHLSPKFVEQVRLHVARLIMRHGIVEGLLAAETPARAAGNYFAGMNSAVKTVTKNQPSDLKPLLAELHVAALNRAKTASNPAIDMVARLAVIKFLRIELNAQFAQVLERCRMMLKSYEGVRQQKAMEYRERVAGFQVSKKIIQRKAAQELFTTLREIEKETLARMRRSLFGSGSDAQYRLFQNPLIFTEDGRDNYLNAEHYVMLGNFDRDPDRFAAARATASNFIQSPELGAKYADDATIDGWLNVPENAQELVGTGNTGESSTDSYSQKVRLGMWLDILEREKLMDYVVASYEVVPLLAEYSPQINGQQLKNALVSPEERERVEKLIADHSKLSPRSLLAAVERVRNAEREKMAARYLRDFLRYHRDLRRLEALNAALDSVNLIGNPKMRELSAMNGTLYEFLLPDEQKPIEERVLGHVVIKADVRDSSRLTKSLMARALNPASYFSLNFYDPVNKLLTKYGATKVFLEGDAVILAILEREGEPGLIVARACVLAREMIEIVRGYNQLLERAGLPALELGIGISYQDAAPMYLLNGDDRIMISDALNESDRLSSCNKRVRKSIEQMGSPFHVYVVQTTGSAEAAETPDEFILNYNLGGIRINEAAFQKLCQEVAVEGFQLNLPQLWGTEGFQLHTALVPLGNDIFRKIVVRSSRMPRIDLGTFSLQEWTERKYYEVCTNPAVYTPVEGKATTGR
jgi:hypothetical protein